MDIPLRWIHLNPLSFFLSSNIAATARVQRSIALARVPSEDPSKFERESIISIILAECNGPKSKERRRTTQILNPGATFLHYRQPRSVRPAFCNSITQHS